jgi:hypothetical protein
MNSKRLYFIMLSAVCLLFLGLIAGAYGANIILQEQSKTVVQARSKSMSLEQEQTHLAAAKASIKKYKDIGQIAKSIVPQDKDQAQTVREIVNLANANGIQLASITFPISTLGAKAVATPANTGSSKEADTKAAAPAPDSGRNLSQLKPATGINGVYVMQIAVQSNSTTAPTYGQFVNFLSALERNRRTALVSSITLTPDPADPAKVSFSLTIDEYIKP